MLPVQGNNNIPAVVERIEVPWSIRFLECFISPLRSVAQWTWSVVVLRAQKDGFPMALLFLGSLGIFPAWIGLAMAVTGVVMIAISVSKVEVEVAELKEGRQKLLEEKRELETQIEALEDQASDQRIDHKMLGGQKGDLEKEVERLVEERNTIISREIKLRNERDHLQGENEQLMREKEEWVQKREKNKEMRVSEKSEVREGLHQRFQKICQQGIDLGIVSKDLQELGIAIRARQQQCQEQVQKVLSELEEDDPLQFTLRGMLEMSEELEEMSEMDAVLRRFI